jgi:O-antigen/teichoic acid export membrane protein
LTIFRSVALRWLPKGQFAKSVSVLAGSAALGRAMTIVASPLLTRLFEPHDFGVLTLFSSLLAVLLAGASLRYEFAIPLPKEDGDAAVLVVLALAMSVVTSVLWAVIYAVSGARLLALIGSTDLAPWGWLVPLTLIWMATYQVLNYYAVRKRAYSAIARTRVAQGITQCATQVGLGLAGAGTIGLLVGNTLGQAAGISTLAKQLWADLDLFKRVRFADVKRLAREYLRFPVYTGPSTILNVTGLQIAAFVLASSYGTSVAGLYGLTNRIVGLPMGVIGVAISQVFFAETARDLHERRDQIWVRFLATVKKLGALSCVIGAGMLASPWAFGIVFGEAWREAGWYAVYLAPAFMAQFIVSSVTNLATYGQNRWQLGWDFCRLMAVCAALAGAKRGGLGPRQAMILLSVAQTLTYLMLFVLNVIAIKRLTPHEEGGIA